MIAQLFIVILAVYSVQADEASFNETRVAIYDEIAKAVIDFDIFLEELKVDKQKLVAKLYSTTKHFVYFGLTQTGKRMKCVQKLIVKIYKLKLDFQHKLKTYPRAIVVRESIEDFLALMARCFEDLVSLNRYFDCPDEECKEDVEEDANGKLTIALEAVRMKEILQSISDNYPGIDAIVEEYTFKHDEIWEEFNNCVMKK